jgi:hypothetical protein
MLLLIFLNNELGPRDDPHMSLEINLQVIQKFKINFEKSRISCFIMKK